MLILGSIFFVVICIAFLSVRRFKNVRSKYSEPISFLLTIIATFIGVFVALDVSNIYEQRQIISKTIDLLEITGYELGQIKQEAEYSNGFLKADSSQNVSNFIESNPLPRSTMLENIINNDIIIRNVSSTTLQSLSRSHKNMEKMYAWMESKNAQYDKKDAYLSISKIVLHIQKIISTEIRYMNGDIEEEDLKNLNEKYIFDLIGIPEKDFQKLLNSNSE